MGDLMKVKITITGKVHDVGYRPFLLDLADSLFIQRFDARNVVINGKQAVIVLIDGEENQVNQFIELIKSEKPENAIVEEIKVEEYKGFIRSIDSYRQSLMVNQLNKIVQVGLKMLEKQDLMLQKQDLMLQKQDLMLQKQDKTIEEIRKTREELSEKIDNVCEKIDTLRMDLKEYFDQRLKRIEDEIEKIKLKLGMV
jgi:acylphosphatase